MTWSQNKGAAYPLRNSWDHGQRPPVPAVQLVDIHYLLLLESLYLKEWWRAVELARVLRSIAHASQVQGSASSSMLCRMLFFSLVCNVLFKMSSSALTSFTTDKSHQWLITALLSLTILVSSYLNLQSKSKQYRVHSNSKSIKKKCVWYNVHEYHKR